MGGTDRMDHNINAYRISISCKKWWWSLFTWLLDVSITNACILFKAKGGDATRLGFRLAIARYYLCNYGVPPKRVGRKPAIPLSLIGLRYDGVNHFMEPTDRSKKCRYAYKHCKSIGRTQCFKCKVGLCVKCCVSFYNKTPRNIPKQIL